MDPVLLTVIAILATCYSTLFGGILFFVRQERREQRRLEADLEADRVRSLVLVFEQAGQELGLTHTEPKASASPCLSGEVDGVQVSMTCAPTGPKEWTIGVHARRALPRLQAIHLRSTWLPTASAIQSDVPLGAAVVETGDPAFDALIEARGPAPAVRALLTADVRARLSTLARRGVVSLADGDLFFEATERPWSPSVLVTATRLALAALEALPRVSDLPAALADVASGDPVAGVRARCLSLLLAEAADDPCTAAILEAALSDPSDAVRVVTAAALGERGVPVLREILLGTDSEEEPAARAIGLLGRRLSADQVFAILDSAPSHGRQLVAAAAVEQLGHAGGAAECQRLQALLCGEDIGLASVAANALTEAPPPVAEPVLLSALGTALPRVRPSIARALGQVAGVATLRHLHAMVHGSDTDPDLVAAAQQAIAAIQARLPGASRGQVSLAEGEAGHVSLSSDADTGRVTLAREDDAP